MEATMTNCRWEGGCKVWEGAAKVLLKSTPVIWWRPSAI